MIRERTGLGTINVRDGREDTKGGKIQPSVTWYVLRAEECRDLASRLRAVGGLRAKKSRDFDIWTEAVDILCTQGGSIFGPAANRLADIKQQLHQTKVFDPEYAKGYESLLGVRGLGTPKSSTRLMHYKKLTQEQVEEIVRLRDEGKMTQRAISERFNVGQMAISRIVNGYYKRVGGPSSPRKITLAQIDEMTARYRKGERAVDLWPEYGVSKARFWDYVAGRFDRRYYRTGVE